jgi:methyl-accepting chemotaxis protein
VIEATILRILSGVARLRDAAHERIVEANAVTERAVMATAQVLQRITQQATTHVEQLQSLRAHTAGGQDQGLNSAVQRQLTSATNHSRKLGELITAQNVDARQALTELEVIRTAAQTIQRLASAARMLALNAQIEAVRLGEAGKPFGVVAAEMKNMAREVDLANEQVGRTADNLQMTLPRIAARAEQMDVRSNEFATDLEERMRDVAEGGASLQRSIHEVLATGDGALQAVLGQCREAFSQLQFQDPVAQQLLMIDQDAYALQTELAELLDAGDDDIRPPATPPLSGEVRIEQVRNGEVVLF